MEIKVCGMRELENIHELISKMKPDWMGLIFYPKSARFVSDEKAAELKEIQLKKVGVFVNESEEEMLRKVAEFNLSAIQLHGNESVELVKSLSEKSDCELWKVISVGDQVDWKTLEDYLPYVNKFLFDTATATHGGSGKKFDWEILQTYPFDKGFLLSGGLDDESADEVLALRQRIPQLQGVDLNSKFEDAPGLKNIEKLTRFKRRLNLL
ncbi:phosphoribosylanthranilate isomerase [Algoriphagus litoralis]|uniref:phosphoribosylanthranilate isomerase n=1 Tax=Algoriphagus litoralis TaxID=2202829 RepID=UPI000DBA3451|nr:phosphoribosylanthranilate isomerase [Algoriphagus litoralis]